MPQATGTVGYSLYLTEAGDTNAVSIDDIHQGTFGDCFLCSTLGELALNDPSAITNMIHDNGNGTYTVTLYEGTAGQTAGYGMTSFAAITETVTYASLAGTAINGGAGQDVVGGVKEIWTQVLEQAYAQANGGYAGIEYGGNPVIAMEQLTGQAASYYAPASVSQTMLAQDKAAGDMIVFDTLTSESSYGLVANHAYMFLGLETIAGVTYVELKNPWGYDDPSPIAVSALSSVFAEIDVGKVPVAATTVSLAVAITAQTLARDTGVSATDNITSNGLVTLTGTVSGASGATVRILDGTTVLGTATLNGTGGWTYTTTLAAGTHSLHAVATDQAGDTASSGTQAAITVETAPAVTILSAQSLTANGSTATAVMTGTVTAASGTVVEIFDGTKDLGSAAIVNGTWMYSTALAIGAHSLTAVATDLAGNKTTSATDTVTVAAPVATPVVPTPATQTMVLYLSEDAFLGNAQFVVKVDGKQVGGVQTVTALHSLGQSEAFTLTGAFGTGAHTIAVTFLNDLYWGTASTDRNLYVNSISYNGVTTVENHAQDSAGTVNYAIPAVATAAPATTNVLSANVLTGTGTNNVLVGNGSYDTFVQKATDQVDTIVNGLAANAPLGVLDTAAAYNQLWFEKSGNDLVIDTLGTRQETVIKNWYSGSGRQLAAIVSSDGSHLDSAIQNLVQAMAGFQAANPAFDPTSASHTSLTDGSFGSVATMAAAAWHK